MDIDYNKDTRIDESALDVECLLQPRLTMMYNQAVAKYERLVAEHREAIEVLKAELTKEIMKNPEKFEIAKVTVAAVDAAILLDADYQEMQSEAHELQYELKMAQAAKNGIQDKKTMLELLVKLHGQNYFAGPNLPRDISQEYVKSTAQKVSNQKVAAKMKIKRRD